MTAKPKSKPRTRKRAAKKPEPVAPVEAQVEAAPVEVVDNEPLPGEAFTPPEISFSARVPPVSDRPRPTRRRAIFIDVENTSRPGRITEALEDMRIDHADAHTDIVASGNWRVIANETARLLARKGAQLVHSAPATGVRDWSDLRIAVAAGVWLASARPGDRLDIVSDDKAFDAVGDVAATLGVEFNRHMKKRGGAAAVERPTAAASTRPPRTRGGRGRRGGRRAERPVSEPVTTEAPSEVAVQAEAPVEGAAPATAAPVDDLLRVVREQLEASPQGVTLDAVANKLKKLGYVRPPNSPRLVTRLRSFKELTVTERGVIRFANGSQAAAEGAPVGEAPAGDAAVKPAGQRRRRRGGRGRGRGGPREPGVAAAPPPATVES